MAMTPEPRTRRLGIATQVFIGLALGLIVGVFFGEEAAFLKIGGDIFIAALQITVIPYVMVALITSLGRLKLADAKALALKAGAVLLVLWAIGLTVVLASPLAFPNWPSASFFSTSQIEEPAAVDFLELYIPSNIFASLANAIVPAIVVFSILFGVALIRVGNNQRVVDLLTTVGDTLMTMTGFIGRLAPYGVFAITAGAAGTIDVTELARLQVYIVLYIALALLLSLWVIPGLIAALTPLTYGSVVRAFRGPLITAFATANLLIVLPVLAADGKRLIAETEGQDDEKAQEESAIDILIPAAFPFPNLGLLMSLMFVLFGGWFVGSSISPASYPALAGAGLAGLFGGTILTLPFLFDMFQLPADLFQMFITVDVIASRFGTLLAGMHIIAVALIGAYAMQDRLRIRPVRLLRFALVSLVLLVAVLLGVRAFYTFVFVAPFTKGEVLIGLPLLGEAQPHRVFRERSEVPPPSAGENGLERIQRSGTLRACYRRSDYPSAFFNTTGDLVGFDIEMAHRFARQLDARVDFVPADSIPDAEEQVSNGYCDVFMSLMPMAPEMTLRFAMSAPVVDSALGLVVKDHRRRELQTWDAIRALGDVRIATADNLASRRFLEQALPEAEAVLFKDDRDLDDLISADPLTFDALLMRAEEGAAWTIRYPQFTLVTPSPILIAPYAYALRHGDSELLSFLDAWILNARGKGTIDELYRYWMLGQVGQTKPPRWSVIRDVLGWID